MLKNINYLIVMLATCFIFSANLAAQSEFTIITAADMQNINDSTSANYAGLGTLVSQVKNTNTNVFFVFGGGSIGPSALSTFDQGSHIIDILNSIEPDVMGVTKREFSYFEDELSLRAYEAAFPVVASNIYDTRINNQLDELSTNTLIQKRGISLGFISILHPRVISEYLLKHVSITLPIDAIKEQALILRQQGADIILVHYSYPFDFIDQLITDKVIDVAFLSNSRLSETDYASIAKNPNIITLNRPGVAAVTTFNIKGGIQLIGSEYKDISKLAPLPEIEQQVAGYKFRLDRLLNVEIGEWDSNFSTFRKRVRTQENSFGNFIADTMQEFSNADIALLNGGSIRGDVSYKQGEKIYRRTIANELPFPSTLKTIRVKGGDFIKALELTLSEIEYAKGGFPHLAGVNVTFDSSRPPGERVIEVKIDGVSLSQDQLYTLTTTNFLANGGDGLDVFSHAEEVSSSETTAPLISDLVTQAIVNKRKVKLKLDGRLINYANNK